ncbi:MAG: DUF58 domain-containing protein [Spirochaetales bacterium]|nr:DUF58 domain-containing protein [Spirochaetales bacterium]
MRNGVSVVFLIITLILGILFPFPIIQILVSSIIFLYLFSLLLSKYTYNSVSCIRDAEEIYCQFNSTESIEFTVINNSLVTLNKLEIKDLGHGAYEQGVGEYIQTLPKKSSKLFNNNLNTQTRGKFTIGPIIISGSDPLNLFPWKKIVETYFQVYVYPKISELELLLINGIRGGFQQVKNPLYEDLSDLKTIRDYRSGDSLKRINWKSSAKIGKLQTMEFSNSLSSPLFLLLDLNAEKYSIKNRYNYLDRCLELASTLVSEYGKRGEMTSIFTYDESGVKYIPPGSGYTHILEIFSLLSVIDYPHKNNLSLLEQLQDIGCTPPSGSHIYIIVPEITFEFIVEINTLFKNRYYITIVNSSGRQVESENNKYQIKDLSLYGKELYN